MKRLPALLVLSLLLSGCGPSGQKTASISTIYFVAAVLSLLLFIGYFFAVSRRSFWHTALYASVFVVNVGYFAISVSTTLTAALFWNRVSYLGSVFLPLSMLLILWNVVGVRCKKWLMALLLVLAFGVFCVAASPGISTIYYESVTLEVVNGASVLCKVYGPWHVLYLFYLLGNTAAMVATLVYAAVKKKMDKTVYGVLLLASVLVNLGVWFVEQLVKIDFEMLSLSYIISGMFLLALHMLMAQNQALRQQNQTPAPAQAPCVPANDISDARLAVFRKGIGELTRTEKIIYERYVHGYTTRQIMGELSITENTLKFHNKNIYGKLGVSSRKELVSIARACEQTQ